MTRPPPGHGDHWYAALAEDDPRMLEVLETPLDAPEGIALHRRNLSATLDLVQVTARRRLVTAYPEPRATTLLRVAPRELLLWTTRVEGWLVVEHPTVGALALFLTDLAENATRYQKAKREIELEVGALAYSLQRALPTAGVSRLRPATQKDDRFYPDDFWIDGDVRAIRGAAGEEVLDLEAHGGLILPVATRRATRLEPGERASGFVWLSARLPAG